MTSEFCIHIFKQAIADYHLEDNVDAVFSNPYQSSSVESLLYHKCWIDTVQWHLEDIIRDPYIEPVKALEIKRLIDTSNQYRTDKVEQVDDWFLQQCAGVAILPNATINTESPAWAIDRLSILALKIYHMQIEAEREDAAPAHRQRCYEKLMILEEQQKDLSLSINELIQEINSGRKKMKVYRQMKMYNDASLNPVLYHKKAGDL